MTFATFEKNRPMTLLFLHSLVAIVALGASFRFEAGPTGYCWR